MNGLRWFLAGLFVVLTFLSGSLVVDAAEPAAAVENSRQPSGAPAPSPVPPIDVRENLPGFYQQASARLTFPLSWTSGKFADFSAWRQQARQVVQSRLLTAPPRADFAPAEIALRKREGYTVRKLLFSVSAESRIPAYLLIPDGAGPFPAVLLLHDHGAEFRIGKEKLVEPFDDREDREKLAHEWVNRYYGGRFIGDELAKRGYVCFVTDALNWSDRGGAGYEGQQALAGNLLHLGMSWAGLIAHEDLRAAEFVARRPEVDRRRIAALGLSMGAFRTWQVSALSDHIAAGVAVCWMATIPGLMAPGNNQTRGQSAFSMTHPGLSNDLDYADVASLACPKPMAFYNGRQDGLFPVPVVEDAYAKLRRVWESQSAGDRLVTKLWDAPHVFTAEMQDEAFAWLDLQLANDRNKQ